MKCCAFDVRIHFRSLRFGFLIALLAVARTNGQTIGEDEAAALTPRPAWTTSRVVGSPEPPPPFTVEPAFTRIAWKNPIFAIAEPGAECLIVVEWPQANARPAPSKNSAEGEKTGPRFAPARAVRLLKTAGQERTEPFLELADRAIYCIEFHPRYRENGQIYVCSKTHPEGGPGINILSRFVVARSKEDGHNQLVCDPATEVRVLEWPSDGHDGGAVVFGHDGMLYVSLGDGTADSDDKLTAQDASNLLGKILRIDVDHPSPGMPYAIPPDNPFLDVDGARGEIWSLGHRNPWRMTVDAKTGALWVGNNGQDLWEFAHLVQRGDNCGWSVYEGSHPFYLNRQLGPGRFAPPTVEHDHGAFRSLTGGVVYYGSRLPGIDGAYVYGDYSTGAIWGVKHDGNHVAWNRELAKTTLDIVCFATTHDGELLVIDYATGIYRLIESPPDDSHLRFPRKLSETGLFASVAEHMPAPGVHPYVVTTPGWTDGAVADRLVALPGDSCIQRVSASQWEFPDGAVLAQTLSLPKHRGKGERPRRIETRLLTNQKGVWCGYSYIWNDTQDDARLAPSKGMEIQLPSGVAPSGDEQPGPQTWRVPSRTDCTSCHSRAANFVLGLSELQADCTVEHDGAELNQLRALEQWKVIDKTAPPQSKDRPRLVNPYDSSQDLEARARSYLHVNCSSCHVAAGGGNSRIQLNLDLKREDMQLVGVFPQHQTFGLSTAMLVAPADPQQSVLYHRISRRGPGQMPPRGTHAVDHLAVQMIHDWIAQLSPQRKFVKNWTINDLGADVNQLTHGRTHETGARLFTVLGCIQCHRFAEAGGGAGPDLSGIGQKRSARELLESMLEPSKHIAPEFAATVIVRSDGQSLQGRVGQEDDLRLVLHTADALAEPVAVLKADIDERYLSSTSTMPDGLLNTLEKSEILDLLAYLTADANEQRATDAE
jgi:uncharacterized repeat protein (TIGR03806 family)